MIEEGNRPAMEVVVCGLICLDVIPEIRSGGALFAPGRTVDAGPVILATGGAVANTGLALYRLGVVPRLMGKIGDDLFGRAIRQLLEAHGPGLADGLIVSPGEVTSYTIILSPPGVDRMLIHAPGCNATFRAGDVDYGALEEARLFHFGYPPLMERIYKDAGAELVEILRRAKAAGVTTALDMAQPDPSGLAGQADWEAILRAALPYVDVFLPSVEELLLMLRRPLFDRLSTEAEGSPLVDRIAPEIIEELGQALLEMGARIVGLKAGQRGLYLRTGDAAALAALGRARPANVEEWADRELWAPCFAVQVVGTTGAGDATIAGFILGLLRGMGPAAALAAACATGACNVEAADATSGVRSWPETEARIAAGWSRLKLDLDAHGWRWSEAQGVWIGPADRPHRQADG